MSCKSCDKVAAEHRQTEYLKVKEDAISWGKKAGIKTVAVFLTKGKDFAYSATGAGYPAGSSIVEFVSVGP